MDINTNKGTIAAEVDGHWIIVEKILGNLDRSGGSRAAKSNGALDEGVGIQRITNLITPNTNIATLKIGEGDLPEIARKRISTVSVVSLDKVVVDRTRGP